MHYIYMVRCSDDSLYTGYSTDITRRVSMHNAGKGARYTKARRPVRLVYFESYDSRHEALSREWHLKQLERSEKLKLIEKGVLLPAIKEADKGE